MSLQPVPGTTQDWAKLSALAARRPLGVWYSSMNSPSPRPHIPQVCPLIQSGILIWGRQQRVLALLPRRGCLSRPQNSLEIARITCSPFKSRKTSLRPCLAANRAMPWSFCAMRMVPEIWKALVGTILSESLSIICGNDVNNNNNDRNLWDAGMVDCWQGFLCHSRSLQWHFLFDEC